MPDPSNDTNTSSADAGAASEPTIIDPQTGTSFQIDPTTGLPHVVDPSQALGTQIDIGSIDPHSVAAGFADPNTGVVTPFDASPVLDPVAADPAAASAVSDPSFGLGDPSLGLSDPSQVAGADVGSSPITDPAQDPGSIQVAADNTGGGFDSGFTDPGASMGGSSDAGAAPPPEASPPPEMPPPDPSE